MARIFISHNSNDAKEAAALKRWLSDNGWDDTFLDIDTKDGLSPGERWKDALKNAADRCEAVLCLISPTWLASAECKLELRYAETLRKHIFLALIKPCNTQDLPPDWQWCPLYGDGAQTTIRFDFCEQPAECTFLSGGLERLKNGLQKAGISAEHFPWPPQNDPDRAPYRGLKPLEGVDAAVFFGRNAQTLHGMETLWDMRRNGIERLLVILGASGSGKSSFMRAGLLPRLERDDRQFFPLPVIRPRNAVLFGPEGLAPALTAAFGQLGRSITLGEVERLLKAGPIAFEMLLAELEQRLMERILGDGNTQPPSIVIPIDQAEELFNPDGAAEAEPFLVLLGGQLAERDESKPPPATGSAKRAIVVLTIRSDRYERLQTAPGLSGVKPHLFDLRPFPTGQFERVINGPAERATQAGRKLSIDSRLTDRLLKDFAEGADTLPLLGFALEKLYHKYGTDGDLSLEDYDAIRGCHETVQEAIFQETIDTALKEPYRQPEIPSNQDEQYQGLRCAFIPYLVQINPENNEPLRQVAKLTDLPADVHHLVERLVEARLLIRDKDAIEVAHESLLRQWPYLSDWINEERDNLRLKQKIRDSASQWKKENQREVLLLHRGELLEEAEDLLATSGYVVAGDSDERAYLNACRAAQQKREAAEKEEQERRIRDAEQIAEEQKKAADAQKQIAEEQTKAAEAQKQIAEEQTKAAEVERKSARRTRIFSVAVALVAGLAIWQFIAAKHEAQQAKSQQLAAQSAPEMDENPELGLLLAVQAHNVAPTVESTDALLSVLERVRGVRGFLPHEYLPNTLALSADGTLLAVGRCTAEGDSGCKSSAVEVWRGAGPFRIGSVQVEQEVLALAFSDDARRLAATVSGISEGEKEQMRALMFDLKGDPSAAAGLQLVKTADRLYEGGKAPTPSELLAGQGALASWREAIERVRRAADANDSDVSLWRAATLGANPRVLAKMGHAERTAPDQIELWDAGDHPHRLARVELKVPRSIREAEIRADGKFAAAWGCASFADGDLCYESELAIFDATGEEVQAGTVDIDQSGGIQSLAVMPRSAYVLSGGCGDFSSTCNYGKLQMWHVEDGGEPDGPTAEQDRSVSTFGGAVASIALSEDGRAMALASQNGRVSLYRLDGPFDEETGWLGSPLVAKYVMTGPDTRHALKCGGEAIDDPSLIRAIALLQEPANLCAALKGFASGGAEEVVAELSDTGTRLAISGCTAQKQQTDESDDCEGPRTIVWSIVDQRLERLATVETVDKVTSLAFAPDGNRIAVATCPEHYVQFCQNKGKLELVDLRQDRGSKRMLAEGLDGVTAIALRPDAESLAFATCARLADAGGAVRDCALGAIHFLDFGSPSDKDMALIGHDGEISDLAFNANGTLLVSGASDGSVALWDPSLPKRLGPVLPEHSEAIDMVRFVSLDTFVSVTRGGETEEGEEIQWNATAAHWKSTACRIAGRNLTRDEWTRYVGDASYDRTCPELPTPDDLLRSETNETGGTPAPPTSREPAPVANETSPGSPSSLTASPHTENPPPAIPTESRTNPLPEEGSGSVDEGVAEGPASPAKEEKPPTQPKTAQSNSKPTTTSKVPESTVTKHTTVQPAILKASHEPTRTKVPKAPVHAGQKPVPKSPPAAKERPKRSSTDEPSGSGGWTITK